jgi:hypothetical protein
MYDTSAILIFSPVLPRNVNPLAFNWDDRSVAKPHGPLHRVIKQGE